METRGMTKHMTGRRTNAGAMRPLHQWVGTFERYWQQHQLNRVKELAEATVRNGAPGLNPQNQKPDPKS
jgi:hypothetical protein